MSDVTDRGYRWGIDDDDVSDFGLPLPLACIRRPLCAHPDGHAGDCVDRGGNVLSNWGTA